MGLQEQQGNVAVFIIWFRLFADSGRHPSLYPKVALGRCALQLGESWMKAWIQHTLIVVQKYIV